MDTLTAFAMGEANRGKETMVFDWDKAAELIRDSGCTEAEAGLRGDWAWTGGCIFEEGKPTCEHYTFLESTWAVPELEINGKRIPCFRMYSQTPGWNSGTKWPESALKILNEGRDQ